MGFYCLPQQGLEGFQSALCVRSDGSEVQAIGYAIKDERGEGQKRMEVEFW